MTLKDISFDRPEDNILYDDVLLELAQHETSPEVLRLWESPQYFIVLGRTGKSAEDVYEKLARQDGIPILRRSSGGGTILQGRGCLNFTLILDKRTDPALADIRKSYSMILAKIIAVLKPLGVPAAFRPVSDLVIESSEKKFSGNAQRRARNFILHHGTILYDFDISLITRYLTIPRRMPDYRNLRSHSDFLANIGISAADIKQSFCDAFRISAIERNLLDQENRCLDNLRTKRHFQVVWESRTDKNVI